MNEETGNQRPVMLSLLDKKKTESSSEVVGQPGVPPSTAETASSTGATAATESTDGTLSEPSVLGRLRQVHVGEGLSEDQKTHLLTSCVKFISVPVDADALNAVMRLVLRFTQVLLMLVAVCKTRKWSLVQKLFELKSFTYVFKRHIVYLGTPARCRVCSPRGDQVHPQPDWTQLLLWFHLPGHTDYQARSGGPGHPQKDNGQGSSVGDH